MNFSSPSELPSDPTYASVANAAERLNGLAVRTPLLESPLLNAETGGRVLVKPEVLQRTGSFKFRGAYNRISRLTDAERARGVIAYSSGNHAQGVAHAAQLCGAPAVIVMPRDAPTIKVENTRAYGAEVVLYDRDHESREAMGRQLAKERGMTLVPPYDDPFVIAGQGTVGLEIVAQLADIDTQPDALLSPCGGGGLIAGTSLAVRNTYPDLPIFAVEPAGFEDTGRSIAAGQRQTNAPGATSFCDALLSPTPGELTFSINRHLVTSGLAVSDDEVEHAMAVAFQRLKIVVEPGGAVALAAVLSGKYDVRGKTAVVITSGGNVDAATFATAIAAV